MSDIAFGSLSGADLVVDATYCGGREGNVGDDPLSRLVGVGNMGGFRYRGAIPDRSVRLCVLYSELADPDWPDALFPETGQFLYYGDNKSPGHRLHETPRGGNVFLQNIFDDLHTGARRQIPPIFVFTKAGPWRDVVFRGLAVPGASMLGPTEDLVAVWKTRNGKRFQNYKAAFTILDEAVIRRSWVDHVGSGGRPGDGAPGAWLHWRETGDYRALKAPPAQRHRSRAEQLPSDPDRLALLNRIVAYFRDHPSREFAFEKCAVDLVQKMDTNIVAVDLTRPWRDGGRDATGQYAIGPSTSPVLVDFALEAKCKDPAPNNSSGVRETARLIGVCVTGSSASS